MQNEEQERESMSKKTTFEVEDYLDRDPLDTDFEEEKSTASATQHGETARKSTRKSVSKSTVSQASTGGVTEDEEGGRTGYNAARARAASEKATWRG